MLYTVGLVDKYEEHIRRGMAIKLGPHLDAQGRRQPGGWVWRTAQEAEAYLVSRNALGPRAVYGVMAEWELDTMSEPGEPTRCLSRDAVVVRVGPARR